MLVLAMYILNFLKLLEVLKNEVFLDYAMMVIKYIDNYISKCKHNFHLLTIQYPEYKEELNSLISKNNFINLIKFESLVKAIRQETEDENILNSREFRKGKAIVTACTIGINSFLQAFGVSADEFKFYHQFLCEVCTKIDVGIIDQINEIIKAKEEKFLSS